ncbi:MAG: cellulase family glycosylhydrolase [Candidatus Omnitrophica bacterium]|nr:cellulase family glycosylhydrolase [Candidatus Omnitrophota bacterium]
MKQKFSFLLAGIVLILGINTAAFAGIIYQNFEPNNGTPATSWTLADRTEAVHLGQNSLKISTNHYWSVTPVIPQFSSANIDIFQKNNDRLTFWIFALPQRACYVYGCENGSDNTVSVTFYDNNVYKNDGFEVWTDQKARYQQWTKLGIQFTQLPTNLDLKHITKIAFKNYLPGKYYIDDIHAVREDRIYQSFDQEFRQGTTSSDYGWKWNDADTAAISADGEPVALGGHSWKLVLNGKWGGTGIQSEQQTFFINPEHQIEQSYWHTNLYPENNDRLSFWVYGLAENGMDNNLNVQFYDHGAHPTDATKVEAWTKIAGRNGQWTRLEVLFRDLPEDLNLRDIDKIQIQHYWSGTFYTDDIRATGPHPIIKEAALSQGTVSWDTIDGAENYRLQQSADGPNGPWVTIYSGPQTNFNLTRLSKAWLRVRWEEKFVDQNSLPYASPWSNVVEYNSPDVVLKFNFLSAGLLTFNAIAQTTIYEIQSAPDATGPWTQMYKGPALTSPLSATVGKWYRVRAITENNGTLVDSGVWSRPQVYTTLGTGFAKASGTVLKDRDGIGQELILTGFNLGNYLLTEDWMTGFGLADNPPIPDEWTMRDVLTTRFGAAQTENLLRTFENAYLNTFDFDQLRAANVTLVRLPIYYRNLMDENGNFILNNQGQIDFTQLDRIVDAMADRAIYTLIDLHGAPGSQSAEFHTGRKNFNKLFEVSAAGDLYRTRTETLWREIAKHYKNNKWVLGYDLLNEPVGAPTPTALAELYDRLYRAIRTVDTNHVIMMEGAWDWDTLPNPTVYGWQNVVYQFHYYCPMIGEPQKTGDPVPVMGESCANYGTMASRLSYHQAFIDAKITNSRQTLYNVPAMVGEFNAYDHKEAWEYYVQTFNAKKWSWTPWNYKDRSSPSSWGIFNHANYDEDLPKLRTDSYTDLLRKFSKFTTTDYHVTNWKLKEILKNNAIIPVYYQTDQAPLPNLPQTKNLNINPDGSFTLTGQGLCDTPGKVQFAPFFCNDIPPGSIACNKGDAAITFWSETLIKGFVPPDYSPGSSSGGINLNCVYGAELYPTMGLENRAPVMAAILNRVVTANQSINITVLASDLDGDILTYTVENAPAGSSFNAQSFNWIPSHSQIGTYNVTFRVSDGKATDEKTVQITVNAGFLPDLTVTALSTTAVNISPGSQLTLSNSIKNTGLVNSESFVVSFYLSTDAVFGGADDIALTGTRNITSLFANVELTAGTIVTIPANTPTGNYYLCAQIDSANTVIETNEVNNTLCTTARVMVAPPDFIVTALSGPTATTTGSNITVSNTIKNQGQGGGSGAFAIAYYLSLDAVITTADLRLGSRSVSTLNASALSSASTVLAIPATVVPGNYYLGAIVDYTNLRSESNETNNSFVGNIITVTSGADLIVTSLSGPTTGASGSTVTLADNVRNQGVASIASFSVNYYLSKDAVISTADTLIGTRSLGSLAGDANSNGSVVVVIPSTLAAGTYYWGVIADPTNQRPESNEINNALLGNAITITPGTDLVVTAVSGPTTAGRGANITINNTVANQGPGGSGYFYVGLYLSTDNVITTSDRFLVYRYLNSLPSGGTNTAASVVTLPADLLVGTYYIGAIVDFDHRRVEQNETNNSRAGNTVVVQ